MASVNSVVIGSDRKQKLAALVTEHTVREHATEEYRFIHTYDKTFPEPKKPQNRSRTGFSFARFAVPELAGYQGFALYLECDQVVFQDIGEVFSLWDSSIWATVLRPRNQTSVLLIDCDHVRWDVERIVELLDAGIFSYSGLMDHLESEAAFKIATTIPGEWNSLERYEAGKTALLHFTNMLAQPWRFHGNPLRKFWVDALKGATAKGRVTSEIIQEEIAMGHVLPDLLKEVA